MSRKTIPFFGKSVEGGRTSQLSAQHSLELRHVVAARQSEHSTSSRRGGAGPCTRAAIAPPSFGRLTRVNAELAPEVLNVRHGPSELCTGVGEKGGPLSARSA